MCCNNEIHIGLVDDGFIKCPFCDQEIGEQSVKIDRCDEHIRCCDE